MAYERKDGDFVLFRNENRKTEKHPLYTGEILLGGIVYRLSAWPKPDRNGKTFIAGNAQEKTMNRNPRMADEKIPDQDLRQPDDFDSDPIPF